MINSGQWKSNGKVITARWKLEARKQTTIAKNSGYGMGGLPRTKRPSSISLPRMKFMEK